MLLSRAILPAFAAAFLATASFAADTPPLPAPHGDHMGRAMQFLTADERMMLFSQMHADTANMSQDQRQAYRQTQRDKFMTMSDADKQAFAAGLKAKWDALPADQKAKIQQDMATFRASHPMTGGGQ